MAQAVEDILATCPAQILDKVGGVEGALNRRRAVDFVEYFCGTGRLTKAVMALGREAKFFDIARNAWDDILTDVGFARALLMALSIRAGGVAWFAVPCSSFVFMSRGHTKRTRDNPMGDERKRGVAAGNRIVSRVCYLLRILVSRHVYFVLEQPAGSILWKLPLMKKAKAGLVIKGEKWARRHVWIGHFGGHIAKPTELYGVFPDLASFLYSRKPRFDAGHLDGIYRRWTNSLGRKRVAGLPGLRRTGEYPKKFCAAVADGFQARVWKYT